MSKLTHGFFLLATLFTSPSALAANRAVEVSIYSMGAGFDAAAYQTVRQTIGYALGSGLIDTFVVYGYGDEGGFSACAEVAAFNAQGTGLRQLASQLRSIRPNPKTTTYSVKLAASCATPP